MRLAAHGSCGIPGRQSQTVREALGGWSCSCAHGRPAGPCGVDAGSGGAGGKCDQHAGRQHQERHRQAAPRIASGAVPRFRGGVRSCAWLLQRSEKADEAACSSAPPCSSPVGSWAESCALFDELSDPSPGNSAWTCTALDAARGKAPIGWPRDEADRATSSSVSHDNTDELVARGDGSRRRDGPPGCGRWC